MTVCVAELQKPKRKTGISLTALIDVVFILLMFFMLTSTFIEQQQLTLNTPAISQQASDSNSQLLVIHEHGGHTFYNDSAHPLQDWAQLTGLLNSNEPLVILPEKRVTLARIVEVMEDIKAQGATTLTLGQSVNPNDTAL